MHANGPLGGHRETPFAMSDLDLHCMPMVLWGDTLETRFAMSDLDLHCMPMVLWGHQETPFAVCDLESVLHANGALGTTERRVLRCLIWICIACQWSFGGGGHFANAFCNV